MNTAIDTIIAEVLSLSPQARAFVAEKLIESLDSGSYSVARMERGSAQALS